MGMDLIPRRSGVEPLHYNWSGWRFLQEFLDAHGSAIVLAGSNDGEWLTADECREIARLIEQHAGEYDEAYGGAPEPEGYGDKPAKAHAEQWRNSAGVRQL